MITLKLQIILVIGSFVCLIIYFNLLRKYKLELRYAMLWLLFTIVLIFLSLFPGSFEYISELMGIELAVNALFLLAIFCAYLIIFTLTVSISHHSIKIKELSQELGMLKFELEERIKKQNKVE